MLLNDALGGLTAPIDLTGVGLWSNQWDTYVTIDTTTATGDATGLSPGFDTEVGSLAGDFSTDNAGWFLTPDDAPQGVADGGRVLVAQFTVNEGAGVSGTLNVLTATSGEFLNLTFDCEAAP